jgi:hypothetical protein
MLVCLQNLHDVLPVILRNDLDLEQINPKGPKKTRLVYFTMCLLLRYLAKNKDIAWIDKHGSEVLYRRQDWRTEVLKQLDNRHSRIKSALQNHFMCLEEATGAALKEAFRAATRGLLLGENISVFDPLAQRSDP